MASTLTNGTAHPNDCDIEIDIVEVTPMHSEPVPIRLADFVRPQDYLITFHPAFPLVAVSTAALRATTEQAQQQIKCETGGLCVGQVFKDMDNGRLLIRIERSIEAQHTVAGDMSQGNATLTFTPDTWRQVISQYKASDTRSRLIAWYHTHPGFGVFLSSMDLFIHSNFFPEPWHLAVVIDPVQHHFGVFVRQDKLLCMGLLQYSENLRSVVHSANSLPFLTSIEPHEPAHDEHPAVVMIVKSFVKRNDEVAEVSRAVGIPDTGSHTV